MPQPNTPARFMTISASDYAALRNREKIFREALAHISASGVDQGRVRAREALTRADYESPISYAPLPAPEENPAPVRSLGPFTDSWPPQLSPMALHPDLPSATDGHKPGDYANRARNRINNRANSGADVTATERAVMDLSYAIDSLAAAFEVRCPDLPLSESPPEKIAPFESFEEMQAAQRERIEHAIARQEPQSLEREIVDLIMRECASDSLTDAEALAAAREVIALVLAEVLTPEWVKKTATCIRAMWNQTDFGPELERALGRSVQAWQQEERT